MCNRCIADAFNTQGITMDSSALPSAPVEKAKLVPNSIHLVRTAQTINMQLSQMADQKASMLMGATFLVFTISIGQAKSGPVIIPVLILAFFAFLSATFAVMTVLPKVTQPPKHVTDETNILFFGVFTGLDQEKWAENVLDRMRTDEDLCRTMLRDIYQNGQVLQRKKYRLLGLAYKLFLTGLVLSFTAFVIEFATGKLV